ncbi:MAG: PH domain-containing protein [Spirochaetales bacterium]|nr:PH domain-containing protein [Spirochaetales bacterium]
METVTAEPPRQPDKKPNPFLSLLKKIRLLPRDVKLISFKELKKRIQRANFYGFLRERFIRFYIQKTTGINSKGMLIAWQPLHFVILKIALLTGVSYLLYTQYPVLSGWLDQGFSFFRLQDIYNFQYPQRSFFDLIAQGILVFIIGYYGVYFAYYQIQSLFSSAVLTLRHNTLFYIRNFLVKKELFIFKLTDIDYLVLKQNLLYRLFGVGTILIKNRAGEIVTIRSLKYASHLVRKLSYARSKQANTKKASSAVLQELDNNDEQYN